MHRAVREADIDDLHTFVINVEDLYTRMVSDTGSDGNDLQPEYDWVREHEDEIREAYNALLNRGPR